MSSNGPDNSLYGVTLFTDIYGELQLSARPQQVVLAARRRHRRIPAEVALLEGVGGKPGGELQADALGRSHE